MPGNLYVVVHVAAHPAAAAARDAELYYELPISITQAALGARLRVPTADGEEEIEIRPGTQSGAEIRLRGTWRAAPAAVGTRRPPRDGRSSRAGAPERRQRELLEQLAVEMGEVRGGLEGPTPADGTASSAGSGKPARRRGGRRGICATGCATRSAERRRGPSAAATWLELAVSADHEAVEQVSEILARVCPGGVARRGALRARRRGSRRAHRPRRPATVRGYISAVDPAALRAAVERARAAPGPSAGVRHPRLSAS